MRVRAVLAALTILAAAAACKHTNGSSVKDDSAPAMAGGGPGERPVPLPVPTDLKRLQLAAGVEPAARAPDEDFAENHRKWQAVLQDYLATNDVKRPIDGSGDGSVLALTDQRSPRQSAVKFSQLTYDRVPDWGWDGKLTAGFAGARDTRLVAMTGRPELRRLSFLFPDDGCYVRATIMNDGLEKAGYPRPAKVFSFGNLEVKSANIAGGIVRWNYHVAPLVKTPTGVYVIDPSIQPEHALTLKDWLLAQIPDTPGVAKDVDSLTVAICSPWTFDPDSYFCAPDDPAYNHDSADARSMMDNGFLISEWNRQIDLKGNVDALLKNGRWWAP